MMKDGQKGLMFFYQEGEPPNFDGTRCWIPVSNFGLFSIRYLL